MKNATAAETVQGVAPALRWCVVGNARAAADRAAWRWLRTRRTASSVPLWLM